MIFRAYFKECREHSFSPKSNECCSFTESTRTWTADPSHPLMSAAEQVWSLMNADNRPNGRTERSLSVGDILISETPDGEAYLLADRFGFTPLLHLPPGVRV